MRATLGTLGRRKEKGGYPNLQLYPMSSHLKDRKQGTYTEWLSNSVTD